MREKIDYTLGTLFSVSGLCLGVGLETLFRFNNFEYPVYYSPAAILPVVGASIGSYLDYSDAKISRNSNKQTLIERKLI